MSELPSDPMWGYHIVRVGKPHKKHPDRVKLMAMIRGGGYAFCTSKDWKWTEPKWTRPPLIPPEAYPSSALLLKNGDQRVTWASSGDGDRWSKLYTYKHKTDEWIPHDDQSIYSSDPCGPSCQLSPSISFHAQGPRGALYHQDHRRTKINPFVKGERSTRFSSGGSTVVNTSLGNGVAFFVNKDYYRDCDTDTGGHVYTAHQYDHKTGELSQRLEVKEWNDGAVTQLSSNLFALIGGYRRSKRYEEVLPLTHLELFTDQGSLQCTDYLLPTALKSVSTQYIALGRVFVKAEKRLWLLTLDLKSSEGEISDDPSEKQSFHQDVSSSKSH